MEKLDKTFSEKYSENPFPTENSFAFREKSKCFSAFLQFTVPKK